MIHENTDLQLRRALKSNGQRFTEQRAAVYRYLASTDIHPTADEVFLAVRTDLDAISLATVYRVSKLLSAVVLRSSSTTVMAQLVMMDEWTLIIIRAA